MAEDLQQILNDNLQREVAFSFLALVTWKEASNQPKECKLAVAFSILNRVERPSWWGHDIPSVVFARLQYSSITFKNDPNLIRWPVDSSDPSWIDCLCVANSAICGLEDNPVPGADSYFDISIPAPNWAVPNKFVKQIGRIRFFDIDQDHERRV